MTISREKLFSLGELFKAFKTNKNKKFQYMVLKNEKTIENELNIFKEMVKFDREAEKLEFENKRMTLIEKYCNKNEDGTLKTKENRMYDIDDETIPLFNADFDVIVAEFKDMLDALDANNAKAIELAKEEIEVDLYKIGFDDLPEDVDKEELEYLMLVVKD